MATTYVTNFAIPATNNMFQLIWKLTRVMKAAGWTTQASSDSATKDTTGTQSNDKWGGSANPLNDVYVTNTGSLTDSTSGGWIVMRGPSTLKMPINAAPTGTLIRGETITQATTNAEGELIGYVWDTSGLTGWAVIAPHTGTFNMTTANTITGSSSGATFAPLNGGTLVTYVREIVFNRTNSSVANAKIQGTAYYICADVSGESSMLFTTLAGQSNCTATVPPGGGSGNNAFPTKGIILRDQAPVSTNGTGWFSTGTSTFVATNNGQAVCINATPAASVSADGSFYVCCSNTQGTNNVDGFLFTRLDDTEPGDVDPYAWYSKNNLAITGWTNTGTNTVSQTTGPAFSTSAVLGATGANWLGYSARGCPVTARDGYAAWVGTAISSTGLLGTAGTYMIQSGTTAFTLLNHPNASPPQLREPIMLAYAIPNAGITNAIRQIKGRTRWLHLGPPNVGTSYDTYDNKNWLVVNVSTSTTGVLLLPYDGATTPTQ